ncbi:MAG: TetR/AcrR family transcriptional regulator [Fimbriimonas sp.]
MAEEKAPYHHGDLRKGLIAEGHNLLREVGPEEFSLRELGRRLQVSPRAPYRHFASKEELLAALAVEGFDLMTAYFDATVCDDPAERLRLLGAVYVRFAHENPALFRLMFSPIIASDHVLNKPNVAFDRLVSACAPLQPPDTLVRDRIRFATAIWSGLHGMALIGLDGVGGLYDSGVFVTPADLIDWLIVGQTSSRMTP